MKQQGFEGAVSSEVLSMVNCEDHHVISCSWTQLDRAPPTCGPKHPGYKERKGERRQVKGPRTCW